MKLFVFAPPGTPFWLKQAKSPSAWYVEVEACAENEDFDKAGDGSWATFLQSLRGYSANTWYRRGEKKAPEDEGLKAIGVRHFDSPVWWCDLDTGPVQEVTLFDLIDGVLFQDGRMLYIVSLKQWDNQLFPAPILDGPPVPAYLVG